MTQPEVSRCECGGVLRWTRTASPWEFTGSCDGKWRHRVTISWAHCSPPPIFITDEAPSQPDLFSEATV